MRTQQTTYTCDACGTKVAGARALAKFTVSSGRDYRTSRSEPTELCDDCEGKFLAAIVPFFLADQAEKLEAMRRD